MFKSFLLFLCVCGAFASSGERGVVSPIITCGGEGHPIEVRVTNCTSTPCDLEPGKSYLIEIDFVASADSELLGFNLVIILDDGQQLPGLDVPVPGSNVIGGEFYTLAYPIVPDTGLENRDFDIQIRLYDTTTYRIEVCVRAPARIV